MDYPEDAAPLDASWPPPQGTPAPQQPPPYRRLRRKRNAKIGGVAGGLASYLSLDVRLCRIGIVVLAIAGPGLVLYLAAWLMLPTEDDPDPRPLTVTSNTMALVAGLVVLAVGVAGVIDDQSWGWSPGPAIVVPVGIVLAGVYLLNQRSERIAPEAALPTRPRGSWPPPGADQPSGLQANPFVASAGPTPATTPPSPEVPTADPSTAMPAAEPPPVADDEPWEAPWEVARPAQPWAMAQPEVQVAPRERTGPPITSITFAAAAVAVGVFLVLANLGGIAISTALVVGTLLTLIGAGITASAFFDRALGLYPLALMALTVLFLAPLVDTTFSGGVGTREVRVVSPEALESAYSIGMGELTVDLRDYQAVEDRTVEVDVGAGYAEIVVPPDLRVEVRATSRAGYVEVFRTSDEGLFNDLSRIDVPEGGEDGPTLTIEADVTFGYVEVLRAR